MPGGDVQLLERGPITKAVKKDGILGAISRAKGVS